MFRGYVVNVHINQLDDIKVAHDWFCFAVHGLQQPPDVTNVGDNIEQQQQQQLQQQQQENMYNTPNHGGTPPMKTFYNRHNMAPLPSVSPYATTPLLQNNNPSSMSKCMCLTPLRVHMALKRALFWGHCIAATCATVNEVCFVFTS